MSLPPEGKPKKEAMRPGVALPRRETIGAAVASVRQGRHYFGIERDGKWFDAACRRVERATAQGRLF